MASFRNHILVPIDFSEQSFIALGQSYNLARLTKADITLINVIDDTYYLPFFRKRKTKLWKRKSRRNWKNWPMKQPKKWE
ncbi:MAG: universal stress protein [Bacteroidetes bacterium]|nr:universal stress protein [Bacteroidota bacterium]